MKRFITAALSAILLCGALAGCGSSPEKALSKAVEKLNTVNSVRYDMNMSMDMSSGGQSIQTNSLVSAATLMDPFTLEMKMTMTMGELGSMEFTTYAEKNGDSYVSYSTMDGESWSVQDITDTAVLDQYDAVSSVDLYLSSGTSFEEVGTETVNGEDAVRYDGVVAKDALEEVMAASGAAAQLTQYGFTEEQAAELYSGLDDMSMSVWISKASGYPVQYEMDMSAVMQQLMAKLYDAMPEEETGGIELSIDKMVISMTLYDFDAFDSIEIPQAAKDAA